MSEITNKNLLENINEANKIYSPIDKMIGKQIRVLRNLRGYSQSTIAKAVGVTFQQFQKYESGVNRLYVSRLIDICNFCEISIVDFFHKLIEKIKEDKSHNSIDEKYQESFLYPTFQNKSSVKSNDNTDDFIYEFDSNITSRLLISFKQIKNPALQERVLELVNEMASIE